MRIVVWWWLVGCSAPPAAGPPEVVAAVPLPVAAPAPTAIDGFEALEPGLELGVFAAPSPSDIGDSRITVVRVDPARFELRAVLASQVEPGAARTAAEWGRRLGLIATINPGMYEADFSRLTFHGEVAGHVNNATWSTAAKAVLLADPRVAGVPPVRIADLGCEDREAAVGPYRTRIQSFRLLDCQGQPAWKASDRRWSHALVGEDDAGRILLIHARSPWSTRALTENLLALKIGIHQLFYGEGGPEASLFLSADGHELSLFGSYETGFNESDGNDHPWPIPNVLGLVRR